MRYGGGMPARPEEEAGFEPRAGQWTRTALAMALVFGSMPLASKLFLGSWGFQEAAGIACLCLIAAAYLHIRDRQHRASLRDDAASMELALRLASERRYEDAIALITEVVRLSPRFWQGFQLRGELYLRRPGGADAAVRDFTEAIRLAPDERHLDLLRAHAHALMGSGSIGGGAPLVGTYLIEPDFNLQKERFSDGGDI